MDLLIIILLSFLFGLSHSILASNKIKQRLVEKIGDRIAFYRIFYNISSIIIIIAILEIVPKPKLVLYDLGFPFDIFIFSVQIFALIGFIWTIRYFDGLEFLGVRQIQRYFKGSFNIEELDEKKVLLWKDLLSIQDILSICFQLSS